MKNENEIVLFEAKDGVITLPVRIDKDTVWLTQEQCVNCLVALSQLLQGT